MHKLSRRDALRGTGVAALAAGAAVVPLVGACAAGGELASMIRLYRQRLAAFNAAMENSRAEDEAEFDATTAILKSMKGVPVQSATEAVMAIDLVFEESHGCMISLHDDSGDIDATYAWLLKSARDYVASEVRA